MRPAVSCLALLVAGLLATSGRAVSPTIVAAPLTVEARPLRVESLVPGSLVSTAPAFMAAQSTLLRPSPQPQHVTVAASPATTAPAGGRAVLWADVTPRPGVHVYAAGASGFTPVALVATPLTGLTVLAPSWPPPARLMTIGVDTPVPAYSTRFRVTQPVRLASGLARGTVLTLAAALNYQACDDRLCYPAASVPVFWTVTVR